MQTLREITLDGETVDDGDIHMLFTFSPESLSNDPIE